MYIICFIEKIWVLHYSNVTIIQNFGLCLTKRLVIHTKQQAQYGHSPHRSHTGCARHDAPKVHALRPLSW